MAIMERTNVHRRIAGLVFLAVSSPGVVRPAERVTPATAVRVTRVHNMHIAYTRMVVEGPVVLARVRLFRDDLEKGFKRKITDEPAVQAALAKYLTQRMAVRADGATLTAAVIDGGADLDADQPIWWVLVQWKATKPVKALGIKMHVLFDAFEDQQNLVAVTKQPSDERRTLYFQAGDLTEQTVKF